MASNRIKLPSSPTTNFLGFNIWLMNTETLFKISCRPNILTFTINTLYQINDISRSTCEITSDVVFVTSNSRNKCTAKDHLVFTDVALLQLVKQLHFSLLGIVKRADVNNSLRFLFFL